VSCFYSSIKILAQLVIKYISRLFAFICVSAFMLILVFVDFSMIMIIFIIVQ